MAPRIVVTIEFAIKEQPSGTAARAPLPDIQRGRPQDHRLRPNRTASLPCCAPDQVVPCRITTMSSS
jgi:hypothetical protein